MLYLTSHTPLKRITKNLSLRNFYGTKIPESYFLNINLSSFTTILNESLNKRTNVIGTDRDAIDKPR